MADELPPLRPGIDEDGHPVWLVGDPEDAETASDFSQLLKLAPALGGRDHPVALALAVNHFAHGDEYRVIVDPAAYTAAYEARLAREDPTAPFTEGVPRLRDFGVPDFASILPPNFTGATLRYFAESSYVGVPYVADVEDPAAPPEYAVVPLTPLPNEGKPDADTRIARGDPADHPVRREPDDGLEEDPWVAPDAAEDG